MRILLTPGETAMGSATTLPKYVQLANALAAELTQLGPRGRFPPVRQIAQQHSVSLVTAVRALQTLRERGLIQSVERSGSFVVNAASQVQQAWALVLHVTAGPFQTASGQVNSAGFDVLGRHGKGLFLTDLFDLPDGMDVEAARMQARRAVDRKIEGVFLLPSRVREASLQTDRALLEVFKELELPVVLIERNLRGNDQPLAYDLVASHDAEGGRVLTQHLLSKGLKRIAFVTGSPCSSHNDRLSGYLLALQLARHGKKNGHGAFEPLVLTQADEGSSRDAYAAIVEQLRSARADGVVCFTDYTALGIILEMLRRGIAVPKDVAVCGFDDVPIGDSFAIGVTTYAFPSFNVAQTALDCMLRRKANPNLPPAKIQLPGKLVVRNST